MNNVYNFMNFLRGENQAHDIEYMVEPMRESIKLAKEYDIPVTFMLQYDALIDTRFTDVIKAERTAESSSALGLKFRSSLLMRQVLNGAVEKALLGIGTMR